MSDNLSTFSIASVAYRSTITDRSLFNLIQRKGENNNVVSKTSPLFCPNIQENFPSSDQSGGRITSRIKIASGESKEIWEESTNFSDTSSLYRKPYLHMGLWSRINSHSCGSLPKEIKPISIKEIRSNDSSTIASYLTPSRGIRKRNLTVFTACSRLAGRSIGMFKNSEKRTYSCKSISSSVKELSKNTHAGTDTLGKKNDPKVQDRVIKQIIDLYSKPTSKKIFTKNISVISKIDELSKMMGLPELIFHRFQATYKKELDICVEKSRVVWAIPYTIVALENIFMGNIIKNVKETMVSVDECIYPIGLTNYQIGQRSVRTLRKDFALAGNENNKIYSLDFEKYDSTIPLWAKDIFFAIINCLVEKKGNNQQKVFDFLRVYIKYTPFVYGKKIYNKVKGISSGLLITNLFDTWWNLTLHYLVVIIKEKYPEKIIEILTEGASFETLDLDPDRVRSDSTLPRLMVRALGDDSIILCDEFTLTLHKKICLMLGMKVTVKHVTEHPDDDIFFLGRYWDNNNRPFQTEEYIALRISYTKWYNDKDIPFDYKDLQINRILSICLPLLNGKEFLDKYLFDYPDYVRFKNTESGFIYMKDFIEDNFKFYDFTKALDVDSF
jgi:hypothetical protein